MNKQILINAKELIERDGWYQGGLGSPTKGYCLMGALFYGAFDYYASIDPKGKGRYYSVPEANGAVDNGFTSKWNDTPGRTKEEVLSALDTLIGKCDE